MKTKSLKWHIKTISWLYAIIDSCNTIEQLNVANKLIINYSNQYSNPSEIKIERLQELIEWAEEKKIILKKYL